MTVALLLLSSMLGGRFGATHRLTLDFIGCMQSGVVHVVDKFAEFKNNYITNWSLQEENKRLLKRGDTYLTELQKYRESYLEARTFEALLNFKKGLSIDPLSARVVGKEPSFWYKTIIVDRGRNDDIEEGMTVFVPEGVVGQIIQVGDDYSKVLLANAPTSAIDAIIQKNRTRGILRGAGSRGYVLNYVLKNADVAVGDYVVTAGIGGLFPTGMVVGTVAEIHNRERGMFQEIEVTPEVDFQKLEYVFIDRTNRKKIIDEMNRAPMK
ncbi:rod shape-determining protein MreC [Desulforhopalus vacuolatus]|uniref:rod shape-determining protein MreC n=1 Tax=Desulforhopalus vacuolatus TaxID=40414 RepID=UPI001962B3F6|nr:rod shape-determining protein MreC [Desulforhopalus vacuolatus]